MTRPAGPRKDRRYLVLAYGQTSIIRRARRFAKIVSIQKREMRAAGLGSQTGFPSCALLHRLGAALVVISGRCGGILGRHAGRLEAAPHLLSRTARHRVADTMSLRHRNPLQSCDFRA